MKYIIICFTFFFLILLIAHYIHNKKTQKEYIIIQLDNPSKKILEENLEKKSPLIITSCISNWGSILKNLNDNIIRNEFINIETKILESNIEQKNTELQKYQYIKLFDFLDKKKNEEKQRYLPDIFSLIKKKNIELILNDINILAPTLKIHSNFMLEYSEKNCKHGLQYHKYYRKFICQLKGKKTYYLFNQMETSNLYPGNKYKDFTVISKVDFWKKDYTIFPHFNKSNFIQINIDEGQILSIPPYWWYASESLDINISFEINYDNFLNIISFAENYINVFSHKLGIKQNFNCVCCE
jgi:hypothetical protein